MTFELYFRASSYAMIGGGALTLWAAGGLSPVLAALFGAVLILCWKLEGTRWQLSERVSLLLVLASLPLFYLDWKFQATNLVQTEVSRIGVGALTHLILFLATVKLLQVKADRDWLFIYLISFFQVLLAAGLSVSPSFMIGLCLYTFCALSTVICFEMRKARRCMKAGEGRLLVVPEKTWFRQLMKRGSAVRGKAEARRLPVVALGLMALILLLSVPIFFVAPRFTGSALTRSNGGLSGFVGFSDKVTLGSIGRLQMSDQIVMRVRVERPPAARSQYLRWRGVALDHFDGREWSRSERTTQVVPLDRGFFKVNSTESLDRLTTQTFYLEPVDTPVLFVASTAVALQGGLPFVRQDKEGSLTTREHPAERLSYRAYSDTIGPDANLLRADNGDYTVEHARYLMLPQLDARIERLAREVVKEAGARSRYDEALALETHLRERYGYSLEMRAGGDDPLADFLFNIREGHCEYFATALAVMLRSLGTATRVVNGFQMGEYNDAADAYIVRQAHAHSWVEVYFPETRAWVSFDPTPADGQFSGPAGGGLTGQLKKYAQALELLWIQYVVSYDRQEQRSLASSLRDQFAFARQTARGRTDAWRAQLLAGWESLREVMAAARRGQVSLRGTLIVIGLGVALAALILVVRVRRYGLKGALWLKRVAPPPNSAVIFYERLLRALAARGLHRRADQTPLEFAGVVGDTDALTVTRVYNRVRFGGQALSSAESQRIEEILQRLERP